MKSLLVFFFVAICFAGYGQIINFPDANFKNALVNTKCVDTDGDGFGDADADLNNDWEIDVNEANAIEFLNISNKSISTLVGIKNFKNVKRLSCYGNQLTSLDVQGLINLTGLFCLGNQLNSLDLRGLTNLSLLDCSTNKLTSLHVQGLKNLQSINCITNLLNSLDLQGLINLKYLSCSENQLTSLNVQGLTNLTDLSCSENQLTSLNIQGLTNLTDLYCYENQLTSLNVQGLTNLTDLSCHENQLTSLNVQGLTNLTDLSCHENQLTSLNIKGLTNLTSFSCGSNLLKSLDVIGLTNLITLSCFTNQLTSLDLQGLTRLKYLFCAENQLNSLDVKGLANLTDLSCSENKLTSLAIKGTKIESKLYFDTNPNLKYICCNEAQTLSIQNKAIIYGLTTCEVNSYCTFTPGGKYYKIQGNTKFDINNNGCDGQDIKWSNLKYQINQNNNLTGLYIANSTGKFAITLQQGTHTITPLLDNHENFEATPSSFTVTFPSTTDTITQNFCITPKGILRQTNITVIPLTPPARPGFETSYKIVWENAGNQIETGTLNFTYDETLLDYISATESPDQIADGIVKWDFSNLLPFEKREITVTLKVNRPTDTPAVNAGDKLYLRASILDNIFTLENTVVGSYDPNDKTCLQGDRVKPDMVGEYVDYLIRFENTGNYAAENVVVKDIIDTKRFDVSTLQITDASHEVYTRIEGNKVEFIFEKIQLPFDDANNDGYIAFKIKTLSTLVLGDSLKNMADIYFDYNFPIRTNEAKTTIALSVHTADITTAISIYPNPVTDILYLQTDEIWTKAEIYDISGRIMRVVSLDSQSIDVSILERGTYFIRLRNGNKIGRVKFVKI